MESYPSEFAIFNNKRLWDALRDTIARKDVLNPFSKEKFRPNRHFEEYLQKLDLFGIKLGGGSFGAVYTAPDEIQELAEGRMDFSTFSSRNQKASSAIMRTQRRGRIGKSGSYPIELTVKVQDPCKNLLGASMGFGDLIMLTCRELRLEKEPMWLPHGSKWLLSTPMALLEGLVNAHLNLLGDLTEHFLIGFGSYATPDRRGETAKSYTVMERAVPIQVNGGYPVIRTRHDLFVFVFQVMHALYIAQDRLRFMHYDLHPGNIMVIPLSQETTISYNVQLSDGEIVRYDIPTTFSVKITDFGLSRVETDSYVIASSHDNQNGDIAFKDTYDVASFLGPTFFSLLDTWKGDMGNDPLMSLREYTDLLQYALGVDIRSWYQGYSEEEDEVYLRAELEGFFGYYFADGYRSDTEMLYSNFEASVDFPGVFGFLEEKLGLIPTGVMALDYLQDKNYRTLPRIFSGKGVRKQKRPKWFKYIQKSLSMERGKKAVLHVVTLNTREAVDDGFELISTCCKIEQMDYLQRNYGVAINGTFTNRPTLTNPDGNYIPKGRFKFMNDTPQDIPDFIGADIGDIERYYSDHIAYIALTDNKLEITRNFNDIPDPTGAIDWFTSGVLLVWDGVSRIDSRSYGDVTGDVKNRQSYMLACNDIRNSDQSRDTTTLGRNVGGRYLYNCNHPDTPPLADGNIRKSRTMILLRDDGALLFIVADGKETLGRNAREDTSEGFTYPDMVFIALEHNAVKAVLLDGGQASNISWRFTDEAVYTTSRQYDYPGSNVIVLSQKIG